nr:hypothetical protein [Tanacetum cinerariifolium]
MNDMMNPRRHGDRNGQRNEGEELDNPSFEGDSSSLFAELEEWEDDGVADDNYEEAQRRIDAVYGTDIEDVIEEEEGFVGKGGFGEEENNMEDVVFVANDLYSLKIQTTVSVDFSKTVDSNPHDLILLQNGNLVE